MIVSELIKVLQQCPGNSKIMVHMEVYSDGSDISTDKVTELRSVGIEEDKRKKLPLIVLSADYHPTLGRRAKHCKLLYNYTTTNTVKSKLVKSLQKKDMCKTWPRCSCIVRGAIKNCPTVDSH